MTDLTVFLRDLFAKFSIGNFPGGIDSSLVRDDVLWMVYVGAAVCVAAIVALIFSVMRRRRPGVSQINLSEMTRGSRRMGYAAIFLFFGGLSLWSTFVPLASAAIAPGVVSLDGSRKTIQHLEGGIIRSIHVREGQLVASGEPLVTLENTSALARYDELSQRVIHLQALQSRLIAEQLGAPTIDYPPALLNPTNSVAAQARRSQDNQFESRRKTQESRENILRQRIAQISEEITGLKAVIAAEDDQIRFINAEIAGVKKLVDKGLERLPRLLSLQRQQAEVRAGRAQNVGLIARNQQRIGETEIQSLATQQQADEEVGEQLTQVRSELGILRSQLPERVDELARTQVNSPISGRVMAVKVTTEVGGLVRPGEAILDIVPDETNLLIDARVRPVDIDTVVAGMQARIILTAYNQRNMPNIYGEVRSVSADRLTDDRTGEPYFLAKVEVNPEDLAVIDNELELVAGMPADVMILTGERTFFDFLVQPFVDSFRRSFREN